MLTTFSSSHTISNTEAAILSRRSRSSRNRSSSFSGFNKRRRERREALLTILMASGKEDETVDKEEDKEDKEEEMSKLSRAMATARQNEKLGFSPGYVKGGGGGGGGVSSSVSSLLSAEESAEAAFADLLNTSANDERKEGDNDVKKLNLSELAKGSRMSEEAVRQKDTNIGGVLGDLINLGSILLKGGHIVKKKDGRV
ncbi:unnamed protein product [Bathycoccus prasinos]|jgi:hypothetical protein